MNDPHVEELIYHIETREELGFADPHQSRTSETNALSMMLADSVVTFA